MPWGPFEPDGGTAQNYVALNLDELKYYDIAFVWYVP